MNNQQTVSSSSINWSTIHPIELQNLIQTQQVNKSCFIDVIENNRIDLLPLLHESKLLDSTLSFWAVTKNNTKVLEWIYYFHSEYMSPTIYDYAQLSNTSSVLQWLDQHNYKPC